MNLLVKVCGMTDADNIRAVEQLGIDLMGFVFYPRSPRCVGSLPAYMPVRASRVGVFVNEAQENVQACADRFGLHYIQLHGSESPDYCRTLRGRGLRLVKAFSISSAEDIARTSDYDGLCDYYLFDTKAKGYGGSGRQFDWHLLRHYRGETPFLLSGGIRPDSGSDLKEFSHPRLAGIDLNSCFELSPGLKDVERIRDFIRSIR